MNPIRMAWSNLTHQRVRTLVSLIGVGFAVLLVFMQLGFLGAVFGTATLIYDQLDFDVMILSKDYVSMNRPSTFLRSRLTQARAAPGVTSVYPITTAIGRWSDPRPMANSGARPNWSILILAVEPASMPHLFAHPEGTIFHDRAELDRDGALLARLDTILIDRSSRPEYGDLAFWRSGKSNELNERTVQMAGDIKIGTGFGYNGLLMTSEETIRRILGWPTEKITLGLVKVAPGANVDRVVDDLNAILPEDVIVRSRASLLAREQQFWLTNTAIGQFFVAGVMIALVVGGIFVYQMMAADISKHLPEYATIRAMGYRSGYLSSVVFAQGVLLAVVGYLPGLLVAVLCYEVARRGAGIPIGLTFARTVLVLLLTVIMCMGSALLAVRQVQRANPADLF